MVSSDPPDGWTGAIAEPYLLPLPSPPAAPRTLGEPACPSCGGEVREADLDGALGLSGREVAARRLRRFGALECDDCNALWPWES